MYFLFAYTFLVYKADVLREVWQRFSDSGPGTGSSDRRVEGYQEQVRKYSKTGNRAHHSLSKHGADATGSR